MDWLIFGSKVLNSEPATEYFSNLVGISNKYYLNQKVDQQYRRNVKELERFEFTKCKDEVEKIKDDITKGSSYNDLQVEVLINKSDEIVIYYIVLKSHKASNELQVFILDEDGVYTFVGMDGKYPFIVCNKFVYDNSDWSDPLKLCSSTDRLIDKFIKYYVKFCDDMYH